MCDFVQDFPADKAGTLASAIQEARRIKWFEHIDDETIYCQLASPEFRLYEESRRGYFIMTNYAKKAVIMCFAEYLFVFENQLKLFGGQLTAFSFCKSRIKL